MNERCTCCQEWAMAKLDGTQDVKVCPKCDRIDLMPPRKMATS